MIEKRETLIEPDNVQLDTGLKQGSIMNSSFYLLT